MVVEELVVVEMVHYFGDLVAFGCLKLFVDA